MEELKPTKHKKARSDIDREALKIEKLNEYNCIDRPNKELSLVPRRK